MTGSFRLCHAPLQVKAGDSRGSPAPQTTSLALGTRCSRRPRNPPPPPPSTLYLFRTPITVCGNDYPSPVVATQAATAAACDAAVVRLHPAVVPPCRCTATSAYVRLSRLLVPICCRLGPRAVVTGDRRAKHCGPADPSSLMRRYFFEPVTYHSSATRACSCLIRRRRLSARSSLPAHSRALLTAMLHLPAAPSRVRRCRSPAAPPSRRWRRRIEFYKLLSRTIICPPPYSCSTGPWTT